MQKDVLQRLTHPEKLWCRKEILVSPSPVPKMSGIYAWYFKSVPGSVPTDGCIRHGDLTLLYVGISPKEPPKNGSPPSKENLHKRIRYHMRGNAEGSTLRLTLGCLLQGQLGIQLRRVGSGKRRTFASGEAKLSQWMDLNAFVTWVECDEPWIHEEQIISQISLPLNLKDNDMHPYYRKLKDLRSAAKRVADELPIA